MPDIDSAKTRSYGRSLGFTDAQLDGVYDHREAVVLDKARRWDEYQAQQKQKARTVKTVKKTVQKPKSLEERVGDIFMPKGKPQSVNGERLVPEIQKQVKKQMKKAYRI